jgi:PAS domain S-box-containing protein
VPDLRLGPEDLGAVAPFLIAFRRDLSIRALGPGWARADAEAAVGRHLSDVVHLVRPVCPLDFDEIARRVTSSAAFTLVRGGLPLRGPIVRVHDDLQVFLGAIWVTSPDELERFGLTLTDLRHYDREYLFALQTKDMVIADAERIARRLEEQRLREQRSSQAMAAQFAVTRVLADAPSLEAAAADLVQAMCEVVGWVTGAVWRVDRRDSNALCCVGTWTRPGTQTAFTDDTRQRRFHMGEGLPGRVWASGTATWIEDVTRDSNFPRAAAAQAAGLHGAFAFPIVVRHDDDSEQVVGVIEAFGAQTEPPDDQVLSVMAALGSQVGQFLQRRESESALRESEERLRLIIDSAIDAVVILDIDGVVRAWNPQAEKTFGWTVEEAVGQPLTELIVPPRLREAHRAGMARYRATGEGKVLGKRLELPAIDRSGREFTVELSISPVHRQDHRPDPDGRRAGWPVLFSGFLRDITDRLEAEAALRGAKESAEAAAAAKSDFLATMSHEIRTPMNAIIGLTGLLLDSPLDNQQSSYLNTVRESGEALLSIINDILDFSKIDAGQLALERLVFAPGDLVTDVLDLFSPGADAKGLELCARVEPGVPPAVVADPGRLRQILNNLVANAIKFTSRGHVEVTLAWQADSARLVFVVSDTGPGIPQEVLPRLFKPFSQADSSMSRRFGGTGLGLAISARLARLMDGTIAVTSQEGAGCAFRVEVPCDPADVSDLPAMPAVAREPAVPVVLGRIRALIVEDNPANQVVALAMLRRLGVRADQASNGQEALVAVERVPYDVILMDCQMPDMDGYTAAEHIREGERQEQRPRVPIVAMTANALKGERERCLSAGMDDYLAKPVRLAQLAAALERWVPGLPAAAPVVGKGASDEKLQSLRALLGDDWPETVRVFEEHSRSTLIAMRDAAVAGDGGRLRALTHTLRGGVGMMGADTVEQLAGALEASAGDGDAATWSAQVDAVAAEFARVIGEYRNAP